MSVSTENANSNGTAHAPAGPDTSPTSIMESWLRVLAEPGSIIELRALGYSAKGDGQWPETFDGFFDTGHLEVMARVADAITEKSDGMYWTLNPLNSALLARANNRAFGTKGKKPLAATDKDVVRRRWLLIDADPVKVAGISATDEEKAASLATVQAVRDYLTVAGWPAPIFADSGNGYHLLFRIDLPTDDGGIVERCLKALAARFNTAVVTVDQSVFNPSRICKLYGTLARKGDNIPERPHRRSRILEIPALEVVPVELLTKLAAESPQETKASGKRYPYVSAQSNGNGKHDSRLMVDKWLNDRNVPFKLAGKDSHGGDRYLITCPFDASHTGSETAIIQYPSGALHFKCFHNSCADHRWQECKEKVGAPESHHYDPPLPKFTKAKKPTSRPAESPDSPPTSANGAEFENYYLAEVEQGEEVVKIKVGYSAPYLESQLRAMTDGWPKRVGRQLFVRDDDRPRYFEDPPDLFAWIGRQLSDSDDNHLKWGTGPTLLPKTEYYAHLQQTGDEFEAVEPYPHWPELARHYYLHPPTKGGDGAALNNLLARFNPESVHDGQLLKSLALTLFAGIPPGTRPAFLMVGPDGDAKAGRGVGKTSCVELMAGLCGGYVSVDEKDEMGDIKKRLLSHEARGKRVILIDNLKTLRFSWAELEAFVTAQTVSGRQLYVGEGRLPNIYTVAMTINGASLSKDMALRSVIVKLARPVYSATWRDDLSAYIEANRWAIIGDIVAELARPVTPLTRFSRWGTWERAVLSHLSDPAALQALIEDRQGQVDDDAEEADLIREAIQAAIVRSRLDPDVDKVLIPSKLLAVIVNDATNERRSTNKVSAHLRTLSIKELRKSDRGESRGWVWCGALAGQKDSVTMGEYIPA